MQPSNASFVSLTVLDDIKEGPVTTTPRDQNLQLDSETAGRNRQTRQRRDSLDSGASSPRSSLPNGIYFLKMIEDMLERDQRQREIERDNMKQEMERLVDRLQQENTELREIFHRNIDDLHFKMREQTEEIVNVVRATSQEQRPFNIESYLDEFSRALAKDVRQLLHEVSALAERKGRMEAKTEPLQSEKLEGSSNDAQGTSTNWRTWGK